MLSNEILDKVFTKSEKKEYLALHESVMGNDMFVELDDANPNHFRLGELTLQISKYLWLAK